MRQHFSGHEAAPAHLRERGYKGEGIPRRSPYPRTSPPVWLVAEVVADGDGRFAVVERNAKAHLTPGPLDAKPDDEPSGTGGGRAA